MNLPAAVKSRAGAMIAGAIVLLGMFLALAGPSWELAVYRLLQDGGCAILWLISAGGIGWVAWRILRSPTNNSLAAVTSVGLGLGIVSLAVLSLGLMGWMNQAWAIGILAAGDIVAISVLYVRGKNWDAGKWLRDSAGWGWLWVAAAAVVGAAALAACFPPGILWGDEPNGYDVVEYHLQVPREWFEAGRIVPLHHNVFSFFPFNVEMHYLLAMFLHAGPWAGMYLAQIMHLGFCLLAACAVYALAGGGKRGTVAALLVAVTPWTGLLAPVAYNEGGTLLFATLAIGWAIRGQTCRQFLLAGIFAGFAAATKLSVAPLVFVGVPLAVIIKNTIPFPSRSSPNAHGAAVGLSHPLLNLAHLSCYVLAAALSLSPWLIRDWKWTGNPVFPEAMSILGNAHFSPVQAERWRQAYLPDMKYRSAQGRLRALWSEVLWDWRYGYVLVPLGIAAIALGIRNRAIVYLGVLLAFQIVFWLFFTHLQSRFMVMAIPIIALMLAQIEARAWLPLCAVAGLAMSVFSALMLVDKMGRYLEIDHDKAALIGRENLDGFRVLDTRQLKDGQSVDLIGDACAFWYQIPMSRLNYKTVFDVDTSDPAQSIDQAWLAGMPKNAVVWPDHEELKRFARTYYGIKPETRNPNDESNPNDK
ncbi:MAG: hypothetical protein ABSH08_19235 [Tepidisphaeraceae bacterium]